jgi:hypothetical protein
MVSRTVCLAVQSTGFRRDLSVVQWLEIRLSRIVGHERTHGDAVVSRIGLAECSDGGRASGAYYAGMSERLH